MTSQAYLERFRNIGLRRWQANFAAGFLAEDSPACHLLTGPVGTGKSHTIVAIIAELAAQRAKRMLVLVPAALREQFRAQLIEAQSQLPVIFFTRQVFREMEAATPVGGSACESKGIYIVSQDLAKQRELADSLAAVQWDLVVVDEVHRMASPQRADLLKRLMTADIASRLLMGSPVPVESMVDESQRVLTLLKNLRAPVLTTSWYGQLTEWDGTVVERSCIEWRIVNYRRNSDESRSISQFLDLAPALESASGGNSFLIRLFWDRASSCLFAFEQSLQRLAHTLRSSIERTVVLLDRESNELFSASTVEDSGAPPNEKRFEWTDKAAGLEIVDKCLTTLESVGVDEKLRALKVLIQSLMEAAQGTATRICVCSMYTDTVSYLNAALDELSIPLFTVTGASSFAERQETVERFVREGGVLLGTDASLGPMAEVSHVIHYDLPASVMGLEQRRGRFDRFGRKSPLSMFAFRDDSGVLQFEHQLLAMISSNRRDGAEMTVASKPQ